MQKKLDNLFECCVSHNYSARRKKAIILALIFVPLGVIEIIFADLIFKAIGLVMIGFSLYYSLEILLEKSAERGEEAIVQLI